VIHRWIKAGWAWPDRDYYTKEDAKSKETRERYVQHVQKLFELLGDNTETAKKNAETLIAHGNSAGKGFDDTGGAARPVQAEKQNEDSRAGRAGTEFRLERTYYSVFASTPRLKF